MKVIHFQRKPGSRNFSIERLFEDIRSSIPDDIDVDVCVNRYPSQGFWHRLYDTFKARRYQEDINHITGDVHFLTYLLTRHKTILTIHDCVTLERLKGIRYWFYWFFWYWLPTKRSAVVTVISKSIKKELERHMRTKKLHVEVIPNCVSPDFQPTEQPFNYNYPKILQVGTKKNKNIERVAAALEGLACLLIIVGKLSESQLTALQQHRIDYENHIGISRNKIVSLYQRTDIVMFASLYEGFGLPIFEAQAVGRPVITSNLFSMPEVGGNGCAYVDPHNEQEIRAAVERIINDMEYRRELIEQGFHNIEQYTPETIAQKYAHLYRQVHRENAI